MLVMLGMEAGSRGSVRETITGEERKEARTVELGGFHSEHHVELSLIELGLKKPKPKKGKLQLKDLGL